MSTTSTPGSHRRRRVDSPATHNGSTDKLDRHTDTPSALEKEKREDAESWSIARVVDIGAAAVHTIAPYWINWAVMVGLIFGGCCSNVCIRGWKTRPSFPHLGCVSDTNL